MLAFAKFQTVQSTTKCLFTVNPATEGESSKSTSMKQDEAYYLKRGPYNNKKTLKMNHTLHPINKICAISDSKIIHWAKNHLYKKSQHANLTEENLEDGEQESSREDVNIALMTEEISDHEIFLVDITLDV